MIEAPDLPLWAAILTAVFVLTGAALTLVGTAGLLRLRTFYERMHASTLGSTVGMGLIVLASMLSLSVLHRTVVVHELLIAVLVTVTAPVTFILLIQAAIFRDRAEAAEESPGPEESEHGG